MPDTWWDNGQLIVSLKNQKDRRSTYTEYADMDLASGYPAHLIWTTKDKRRIAIPNMSDQHLLNTVAYLRRRSEDYRKMVIAQLAKGVAEAMIVTRVFDVPDHLVDEYAYQIDKLKGEAKEIFNMDPEALLRKVVPIYTHLLTEAYRRKLLIEVDASKIASKPSPTSQPKAHLKSKPKNTPQDWRATIDTMRQAAIDFDGIEVHKDDWPAAEHIVKNYPGHFNLGPARGPDNAWKRLYYNQ